MSSPSPSPEPDPSPASASASDPLFRAVQFLREAPEPGWDAIAGRVISTIRSTSRISGQPLAAQTPPDRPGAGRIFVSDHVLRSTLAIGLRERYLCSPTRISFEIDKATRSLRAVAIELTGSYGTSLEDLADQIRTTTTEIIVELLGGSPPPTGPVDVTITDVVAGDPLTA